MAQFLHSVSSNKWVIISEQRLKRPDNFVKKGKKVCPFCPGDEPKWQVRVIPNKYPITDIHEVVVHSPDCEKDFELMSIHSIELVLQTYRERFNRYQEKGQVLIFCNHGEHAGASIKHPHSQIVVIPHHITIDALPLEPVKNVVRETDRFTLFCPDFSQWPYEVWIAPKEKNKSTSQKRLFGDISDDELRDLAELMQFAIKRIHHIYNKHEITHISFGYNFYLYPGERWYIRIIPRFIHLGGFELGTGLSVNIVDPANAALDLQSEEEKTTNLLKKLKKFKSSSSS